MQEEVCAVIDASVFVSAFITRNENSPVVKILRLVQNGAVLPIVLKEIIEEYKAVLSRPKFHIEKKHVDEFVEYMLPASLTVSNAAHVDETLPDPNDISLSILLFYIVFFIETRGTFNGLA